MEYPGYAYLHSVEQVDQYVGQIFADLEREGVLDDTVVMFFGDHGRPMPWGKQWLSVEGLRVPLLISGPNVGKRESVESRVVSLIDLAPSMMKLAGLIVPDWMEGQPILGVPFPQREHVFAARDRCGDADERIRAILTGSHLLVKNFNLQLPMLNWSSYKEVSYPGMPLLRGLHKWGELSPLQSQPLRSERPEIELYDLQADPKGLVNIAANPREAETVATLREKLGNWIAASGDRGALPPSPTEPSLSEMQKNKRARYHRTWQKRGLPAEPTDMQRTAWWLRQYGLPEMKLRTAFVPMLMMPLPACAATHWCKMLRCREDSPRIDSYTETGGQNHVH